MKKNIKNFIFYIIGIIFVILGVSLLFSDYLIRRDEKLNEEKKIDEFYKEVNVDTSNISDDEVKTTEKINKEEKYIAVLKIPKIKLEKGMYSKSSKFNQVNYGIQILEESDKPDKKLGNVILASHSGSSRVSYFKNLDKLIIDDDVELDYNNKKYMYKVYKIYDIEKTGKAVIEKDIESSTLTLITCRDKTNKQIIIICKLVEVI